MQNVIQLQYMSCNLSVFFNDDALKRLLEETNAHANHAGWCADLDADQPGNPWVTPTVDEMGTSIALSKLTGIVKKPYLGMYWSTVH